jgi:hypothetical protein
LNKLFKPFGNHRVGLFLLACALLFVWIKNDMLNPIPFYTPRYDPEMPYFLNSLSIFKGISYHYIDHPGTPVELLGTAFVGVSRVKADNFGTSLWMYNLEHPEFFLRLGHLFLTVVSIFSVLIIGLKAFRIEKINDAIVALGASVAFFSVMPQQAFTTLVWWSHNSFAFTFGGLLLVLGWMRIRSDTRLELWQITVFGLAAGVLTAVQLYFASWVVGLTLFFSLEIFRRKGNLFDAMKAAALTVSGALLGFVLATLPIIHEYREFLWWVRSIITHQGIYGSGPLGILTRSQFVNNLVALFEDAPRLFIGYFLVLAFLGYAIYRHHHTHRDLPGWMAAALGVTAQSLCTLFLVAKHPGTVYLLSIAAQIPLMMCLVWVILRHDQRGSLIAVLGAAFTLCLFILGLFSSFRESEVLIQKTTDREAELKQLIHEDRSAAGSSDDGQILLWVYGSSSACLALQFGDFYTDSAFRSEIFEICPRDWMYDIWQHRAITPNGTLPISELEDWDWLIAPTRYLPDEALTLGEVISSSKTGMSYIHNAAEERDS